MIGLGLLFAACSPRAEHVEGVVFEVSSPSDGARLSLDAVPLLVRLPPPFADADVRVSLGEADLTDPLAVRRQRKGALGDGMDYLATLSLADLPAGEQRLHITLTAPSGLTIVQPLNIHIDRPPNALSVRVDDGNGTPVDARLLILRDGAPLPQGPPDALDPWGRDLAQDSVMVIGGARSLHLPDGTYTLLATRGVRSAIDTHTVTLPADAGEPVSLSLPVVIDTPGWLAADLHVHSGRSRDAFVPDRLRIESLAASGLDVAVITDHDRITDLSAELEAALGPRHPLRSLPGVEATVNAPAPARREKTRSIGHINAFPISAGPLPTTLPDSFSALLSAFRARAPQALLQLNHPRGLQLNPTAPPLPAAHALLNATDQGRSVLVQDGAALDLDAIELFNRSSVAVYWQVRQDWFWLLSQGVQLTGTGNSDSHAAAIELAGFPINLVRAPLPEPGAPLDGDAFTAAIRGGAVSATTGPIVSLSLTDAEGRQTGLGETASGPGPYQATLRVQAAAWVPVDELRLIVDGAVAYQEDLSAAPRSSTGALDLTRTLPVNTSADSWVIGEAGWPLDAPAPKDPSALGVYATVAPHYVPAAFTNPIYVDHDGDGAWAPFRGDTPR